MVPNGLRTWFVIHFVADTLFAIPMFFAPVFTMELLGWTVVDPVATRLVGAALFGIGIESLLGRNANVDAYRAMLRMKSIWCGTATIGLAWSALEGGPPLVWALTGVFAVFCAVWNKYRIQLGPGEPAETAA